jgi:hypothetical protein
MTERWLWIAILASLSIWLTPAFTCITPFAAFAVITAATLSGRQAVAGATVVWLVNQLVGFGALGYPWTGKTLAWGAAIGAATIGATLVARSTLRRVPSWPGHARGAAAFATAFVTYEIALYALAATVLGGTAAFAPRIVAQVLLISAVTTVGLFALHRLLGATVAFVRRHRARVASAPLAADPHAR